jgi:chromosome partitioning protein
MSNGLFQFKRALQVFGCEPEMLATRGISPTSLPPFARSVADNRQLKSWSLSELPLVGQKVGFMKKPKTPIAIAVFVTKGGVLKSSLTLNLARLAALHGLRTCVVGLDMQGDITEALSAETREDSTDDESLEEALAKMNRLRGLADVFSGEATLDDVIQATDVPNLSLIPETPELVALDQSLVVRNRREYWLRDQVVIPLKERFDLVLMDCSPNWNRLITNALVAADALVSPVECKINNFRNLKTFRALIAEFKNEMGTNFKHVYVATRLSPARKLSREIYDWYRSNLPACTETAIRESVQGEEAMALKISIPEYAPISAAADEMRTLIEEIWLGIGQDSIQGDTDVAWTRRSEKENTHGGEKILERREART